MKLAQIDKIRYLERARFTFDEDRHVINQFIYLYLTSLPLEELYEITECITERELSNPETSA